MVHFNWILSRSTNNQPFKMRIDCIMAWFLYNVWIVIYMLLNVHCAMIESRVNLLVEKWTNIDFRRHWCEYLKSSFWHNCTFECLTWQYIVFRIAVYEFPQPIVFTSSNSQNNVTSIRGMAPMLMCCYNKILLHYEFCREHHK